MKINIEALIVLFLLLLGIIIIIIFYFRVVKYNKKIDMECEEEHYINETQKACCADGKCKIKDI